MSDALDTLKSYLAARQDHLSGHELAPGPTDAAQADYPAGLLLRALQETRGAVSVEDVDAAFGGVRFESGALTQLQVIARSITQSGVEAVASALDDHFGLGLDASASMRP